MFSLLLSISVHNYLLTEQLVQVNLSVVVLLFKYIIFKATCNPAYMYAIKD